MVHNFKCSGKRCPMQWNVIKPDQCELYEKCECYTPDMFSDNEKLKWLALMFMIFCGDEPADINVNPSDVATALRICASTDGCEGCPYDEISGCYEKVKLDAAKLIDFVNIAQKANEFNKEKHS